MEQGKGRADCASHCMRKVQRTLHLEAARDALHTPLAEVLAVVAKQAIAVFPKARTSATDYFVAVESRRGMRSDEERVSVRKERHRNLFHRSPAELKSEGSVVHDTATAHVDAVVGEGKTRCEEVRAQRRLFGSGYQCVAWAKRE